VKKKAAFGLQTDF
jgi:hypothetical protein